MHKIYTIKRFAMLLIDDTSETSVKVQNDIKMVLYEVRTV